MHCYRLSFSSPFHVYKSGDGCYQESDSFIHSDTLSAAILAVWSLTYPEQARRQLEKPGFKLSSAFPFYKKYYFLPRPLNSDIIGLEAEHSSKTKKIQKIRWLESNLWHETLRNPRRLKNIDFHQDVRQDVLASLSRDLPQTLWTHEERPRFTLDRFSNQATGKMSRYTRVWFNQDGGLYFLAVFDNQQSQKQFEIVLGVLADTGIGADRGNGNGLFGWEAGDNPGLELAGNGKAVSLSLVNPAKQDFQNGWLDSAAYRLISRSIRTGEGLPMQNLEMFGEGSVFVKPLQGRMVDVSANNAPGKAFRDGRGFCVRAD